MVSLCDQSDCGMNAESCKIYYADSLVLNDSMVN